RDEAAKHPLIEVWSGHAFTNVEPGSDQVTATVVDQAASARKTITADYLVAGDGARSTVRRCLGVGLDETGESGTFCSVYFRSRDPQLRRYGRAFLTIAAAGLNLVSRDEDELWTASFPIGAHDGFVTDPIAVVQQRLGTEFAVDELISVAQWEGALAI